VLNRGLQTSVRNNASAYGYSVTITTTFAVSQALVGSPTVGQIFLFLFGAVVAFGVVELLATRGFTERMRVEPGDVIAFGGMFSFVSCGLALGVAALGAELIGSGLAWPVTSFAATVVLLVLSGVELAVAERIAPTERSE
jgi:hypothetical protein